MATGTDDTEFASARNGHDYQLDRRITILETRFDTILPLLANKADLAGLRADMKADLAEMKAQLRMESSRLSRWMAGMFITMILGFGGLALTMMSLLRQ
jgi:hypothetical protein